MGIRNNSKEGTTLGGLLIRTVVANRVDAAEPKQSGDVLMHIHFVCKRIQYIWILFFILT
jgi:hypothetical protein